jgi:Mn-dependent DtxR family transcriptional regulator
MKQEDYLETIYLLNKEKGYVRVSDIATVLQISKPSVTQMVKRLESEGFLRYEPYAPIVLTPKGETIGKNIDERHQVLSEFLSILGIPEKIQEKDIHGIEHHISPITLKKLKEANEFLKAKKFS